MRILSDNIQLLHVRKLSNRTNPAGERRLRSKRQTSYAISAVLYVRPQGHFTKPVTVSVTGRTMSLGRDNTQTPFTWGNQSIFYE